VFFDGLYLQFQFAKVGFQHGNLFLFGLEAALKLGAFSATTVAVTVAVVAAIAFFIMVVLTTLFAHG
jgi:hypothetical protein